MNNKEKNFVSAVIYVHNNEITLKENLKIIYSNLEKNFGKFEIICVNDASTDGSIEIIKKFCKERKNAVVNIINMSYYQGLEASMHAGVDLSIGDFVYEFDSCDDMIPTDVITDIYFKSLKGYDIVSASPNKTKTFSKIFYDLFNRFSNIDNNLNTETARIISRRAINRIHSLSQSIPYRKAVYANCGLKLYNVKYDQQTHKKTNNSGKLKLATNSLILFTDVAYKSTVFISLLMMLLTIFVSSYTVYTYFSSKPIAGWTTTMLFLSISFFGVFLTLSIIIKYLSIILDMMFKKQNYIIESIVKINE